MQVQTTIQVGQEEKDGKRERVKAGGTEETD